MESSNPLKNSVGIQFSGNINPGQDFAEDIGKPISALKLKEHIEILQTFPNPNDPSCNGFDTEFNFIEQKTAQEQYFGDYKSAFLPTNKNKNRYSNVLPPEKTRVILKEREGEEGSDYINANYINGLIPGSEKAYIATQGPLQSTFADFWRMVWELNSVVIVMLTKEVENGRTKCDRYWPEYDFPLTWDPYKVSLTDVVEDPDLTHRKLTLENLETKEVRQITQFQYTAWPDHGLPVSTAAFVELADLVDSANTTNSSIVVHCSAGIGRSGTFCTVHATKEKFLLDIQKEPNKIPDLNIVETVLYMREQRPGMVQTKEQFQFCYITIMEEAEKLLGEKMKQKDEMEIENGNGVAEIKIETKLEDNETKSKPKNKNETDSMILDGTSSEKKTEA